MITKYKNEILLGLLLFVVMVISNRINGIYYTRSGAIQAAIDGMGLVDGRVIDTSKNGANWDVFIESEGKVVSVGIERVNFINYRISSFPSDDIVSIKDIYYGIEGFYYHNDTASFRIFVGAGNILEAVVTDYVDNCYRMDDYQPTLVRDGLFEVSFDHMIDGVEAEFFLIRDASNVVIDSIPNRVTEPLVYTEVHGEDRFGVMNLVLVTDDFDVYGDDIPLDEAIIRIDYANILERIPIYYKGNTMELGEGTLWVFPLDLDAYQQWVAHGYDSNASLMFRVLNSRNSGSKSFLTDANTVLKLFDLSQQ